MFKQSKKILALLAFVSIFSTILFVTSCQEEPTDTNESNTGQHLSKFILPYAATFDYAELHLYMNYGNSPDPRNVDIYQVLGDWDETTVNWGNRPPYDNLNVYGSFLTDGAAIWKVVDISDIVEKWINCEPNYGLLLDQRETTPDQSVAQYSSKEGANPEFLRIYYTLGGVQYYADEPAMADAYIWNGTPSGNTIHLETGYVNGNEKQSLIKFDIECTPPGGCTLTPGYWKTHSKYGPAPYDDTWALLLPSGEDSQFFLSGKTYINVLKTSPAGNAYYILSFQYIAAKLNFLNGADPAAAQAAFNTATTLFNTYTPAYIKTLKGNNSLRQQFISLAGILGNYNEGIIGPGHCTD